jgi:hypothetical protein
LAWHQRDGPHIFGAIVSGVTSQPASIPPGSIWPRPSPTSLSFGRFSKLPFLVRQYEKDVVRAGWLIHEICWK